MSGLTCTLGFGRKPCETSISNMVTRFRASILRPVVSIVAAHDLYWIGCVFPHLAVSGACVMLRPDEFLLEEAAYESAQVPLWRKSMCAYVPLASIRGSEELPTNRGRRYLAPILRCLLRAGKQLNRDLVRYSESCTELYAKSIGCGPRRFVG